MSGYNYAEHEDPSTPQSELKMYQESSDLPEGNKSLRELAKKVVNTRWTIADIPLLEMVRTDKLLTQDKLKQMPATELQQYLMSTMKGGKSRLRKKSRRRSKRRRSSAKR